MPSNVLFRAVRSLRLRHVWGALVALLALHGLAMYMMFYSDGACDDKAVHYYSSAYVFAGAEKRAAIREATPAWERKLSRPKWRKRMRGRLQCPWNYMAADVLIAGARKLLPPSWVGESAALGVHMKAAMLTMQIAALAFLIGVGRKAPVSLVAALTGLAVVGLRFIRLQALAYIPAGHMSALVLVPRGSATVLIMAILVAASRGKKGWCAAGAVLLVLWHAGLSALTLPVLALSVLGQRVMGRLFPPVPDAARWPGLVAVTGVLLGGLGLGVYLPVPDAVQACVPLALVLALALYRPEPGVAAEGRRLLLLLCWFLLLSKLVGMVVSQPNVTATLERITGIALIHETAMRLSGIRYWFAAVVVCMLPVLWGQAWLHRCTVRVRTGLKAAGLVGAFVVWLATADYLDHYYHDLFDGKGSFFEADCTYVTGVATTEATLTDLHPGRESEFFYSLAQYLFRDEKSGGE